MSEAKGIKETKELFDGLALVAKSVKAVMKDGKVDLSDVGTLVELGKNIDVLSSAIDNIGDVPEELKDLDKAEILELIMKVYKEIQ